MQLPDPLISILDKHQKRCESIDGFRNDYKICTDVSRHCVTLPCKLLIPQALKRYTYTIIGAFMRRCLQTKLLICRR